MNLIELESHFYHFIFLLYEQAETGFYFMGPQASETLQKLFIAELDGEEAKPMTVEVIMGRKLKVHDRRRTLLEINVVFVGMRSKMLNYFKLYVKSLMLILKAV